MTRLSCSRYVCLRTPTADKRNRYYSVPGNIFFLYSFSPNGENSVAMTRLRLSAKRYRPFQSNGIYKLSDQFYRKVGIKNTEEKLEAAYWMKRINPEDL